MACSQGAIRVPIGLERQNSPPQGERRGVVVLVRTPGPATKDAAATFGDRPRQASRRFSIRLDEDQRHGERRRCPCLHQAAHRYATLPSPGKAAPPTARSEGLHVRLPATSVMASTRRLADSRAPRSTGIRGETVNGTSHEKEVSRLTPLTS